MNSRNRLMLLSGVATLLVACGSGGMQPPEPDVSQAYATTNRLGFAPVNGSALQSLPHRMSNREIRGHHSSIVYVSDAYNGQVQAYDYKSGTLIGTASGFYLPYGLCSDKRGNVYVADFAGSAYEIKARTTTVIKTWQLGGWPLGCSVNPLNGDLAITIYSECCGADSPGGVYIIPSGSSKRTFYSGPGWYEWPAGYDKNGNLFLECNQTPCNPSLAELPYKGNSYELLNISGATLHYAGAVEWDGMYIGVDDQACNGGQASCIYQMTVSGSTATVVNTVQFSCPGGYPSFVQWAEAAQKPNGQTKSEAKAVAAGPHGCPSYSNSINVWPYPAGGNPMRTIASTYGAIDGATIVK